MDNWKQRSTFHTPFEQYREREGEHFTMLPETERAEETDEVLYTIRFDDGTVIQAWAYEVFEGTGALVAGAKW